jgi:hypothetical protein
MDPRPGEARSERLGLISGPLTTDPKLRKENYSRLITILWSIACIINVRIVFQWVKGAFFGAYLVNFPCH